MVGSVQALVPERFGSAPPESRSGLRQAIGPLAPLLLLCRLLGDHALLGPPCSASQLGCMADAHPAQ
jgi:hypothetical protein